MGEEKRLERVEKKAEEIQEIGLKRKGEEKKNRKEIGIQRINVGSYISDKSSRKNEEERKCIEENNQTY